MIVLKGSKVEELIRVEVVELDKKKKWSNKWFKVLILIFLFLVIGIILVFMVILGLFILKDVKVFDVVGMKYMIVVNILVEKGFEVMEFNIVYIDDVEVGDVIKMDFVVGRVVKENVKIIIY